MRQLFLCFALACAWPAGPAAAQTLQLETVLRWDHDAEWFGGLSGIEVWEGGSTFFAISDRGHQATGRMIRSETGMLQRVQITAASPILYSNGLAVKGPFRDAEGLAIGPDGKTYLSFEGKHRAAVLNLATGTVQRLSPFPDDVMFTKNRGIEALAIDDDDRLIALPEDTADPTSDFPLYALRHDRWHVIGHVPRRGPFLPVGADIGDDGDLYLLERAASPLGFRSRIRLFQPPYGTGVEKTLLTTGPGRFDNLEGLTVWTDHIGETRLTLVSDDNFLAAQQTQIVEYRVRRPLAPSAVTP